MTREHTPRPGVTWETRLTTREVLTEDDSHDTPPVRPNRAARRAAARANRKAPR